MIADAVISYLQTEEGAANPIS